MKLLVGCALLVATLSPPLAAQVYKIVDEQGRVTYTDSPPPKGQRQEQVELKPINRQPPVEIRSRSSRQSGDDESDEAVEYFVQLVAPTDEAQIPPGQRDLQVQANVRPALRESHGLQFIMDGQPLNEPGTATSVLIEEIYRGEHSLSARVVSNQGEVLAESSRITVYVFRPTVNSPARRRP